MHTPEPPRGHRLRVGRCSEAHRVYLVTSVTAGRRPLFRDIMLGRILVRALRWHERRGDASTLAFVVMPDHLHWLCQLGMQRSLSAVVASVKSHSARHINATRGTLGRQIWQPGFHDHAVRREENLSDVARYVIANPLRARLVRGLGDYPLWDSIWL